MIYIILLCKSFIKIKSEIGGAEMNLEHISQRMDSINRMRAISDANKEALFHRKGLSRLNNNQEYSNSNYTEVKNSKLFLRFGISFALLGIVYLMDDFNFDLFSLTSEKIRTLISYNIEFEDMMTFWYNDSISKIVETLLRTK